MKLLVTGHAEHGKDTVCEIVRKVWGLNFVSSSYFVAEKAVRPYLAERGIVYPTLEACYADRSNHRAKWHDAIHLYNWPNLAHVGQELFAQYDIYCGLRNREEFLEIRKQKLFDVSIWVDAIQRKPPESRDSMQIRQEDCDLVLDNNTTLRGLEIRTFDLIRSLAAYKNQGLLQPGG